ncbi:MAG: hypothetical protein KJO18_02415, partial [Acidimicrobiia bacterium]|nr:hypothetical protein [Acidimicrobiia bacterium]
MRTTLIGIAAGVAGAALAAGGLALGNVGQESPPVGAVATTTTRVVDVTGEDTAQQVGHLGSSIVEPTAIDIEPELVVLQFELRDIAPPEVGHHDDNFFQPGFRAVPNLNFGVTAPELWTLITRDGTEYPGTTSSIRARSARFPVPEDFDPDSIAWVRIDQFRQRIPVSFPLDFAVDQRQRFQLDPDTAVSLDSIIEQSSGITYRFVVEDPFDSFSTSGNFGMDHVGLVGAGPG